MPELSRVITSLLGGMTDRPGVDVNSKFSKISLPPLWATSYYIQKKSTKL